MLPVSGRSRRGTFITQSSHRGRASLAGHRDGSAHTLSTPVTVTEDSSG